MSIPCESLATKAELEALATKAELQELRNQINQLLGQPETEDEPAINVLGTGTLAGTVIAGTIFKAKEAITDVVLQGTVKDSIGKALADGTAQWVKVKGSGSRIPLPDLQTVTKNTAGKAAIGVKGAKVAASSVGLVANLATIIGTLGINIATVKILGNRIDQVEKAQLGFNQDYTNLINILNRNNQDLEAANADISELQGLISEQQFVNSELFSDIESAQDNIDDLTATVEKQQEAYNDLEANIEEFKTEVTEFEIATEEQIEDLNLTINDLETNLNIARGNIETLYEVIEQLSIDLADAQKRITEQEGKIIQLQITSSVLIADIINLKSAIEADQDLTDARLDSLEAEIVLAKNNVSRGGTSTPAGVRETLVNHQTKTLELMNKLSSDPLEELPAITYPDILFDTNPFNGVFEQLFPTINPSFETGGETVDFEEFNINQDQRFTQLATAIAGLTTVTNTINSQTTAQAITNAAETAVCNTTSPTGCLTQNIRNPIQQGQNTLSNLFTNSLQGLDLVQGQQIFNLVSDTNSFMRTAWSNLRINKILDYLNTILLVHNAAMLSKNLAASLGDSISALANNTIDLIKNEDGSDIDINATIGTSLEQFLINLLGQENYTDINQTFQKSSRILNAATNIINTIQFSLAGLAEGLETVGNYTGRIGNSLKKAGAVFENAYGWMNETFRVKTGRLGQIQSVIDGLESVENITSDLENVSYEFREVQENVTQIGGEFNKIKTEVGTKETEKNNLETITKTNSQGAQPTASDYTPDPVG